MGYLDRDCDVCGRQANVFGDSYRLCWRHKVETLEARISSLETALKVIADADTVADMEDVNHRLKHYDCLVEAYDGLVYLAAQVIKP